MSKNNPVRETITQREQPLGRAMSDEEARKAADRLLPSAHEIRDMLVRLRPRAGDIERAVGEAIYRAVGATLADTACDYIAEHLERLMPKAVDEAIRGEWETYVNGHKAKESLQKMVVRKLEEAVQRDIAARYEVNVSVTFTRKD